MTNDNRVEQEYIKPLIEKNVAQVISKNLCNEFNNYISAEYPWHEINLYRIDWDKAGEYKRLNWRESSEAEDIMFFKKSCLHSFEDVAVVFGKTEPGLLMKFDAVSKHLEDLSVHVPLTFFMVGAQKDKYGIISLEHKCFIEMDMTKRWLTAPINNMSLLS